MLRIFLDKWKGFSPKQQASVVIFCICGILVLGLAAYRIRHNVYEPFLVDKNSFDAAKKIVGLTDEQIVEQQQRRDTDGDGISDWEETNHTHTNPNLYDSCGDGIPDNIRVLTGKNIDCSQSGGNITGKLDLKALLSAPKKGQVGYVPDANDVPQFDAQYFKDMAKLGKYYGASGTQLMGDGNGSVPAMARNPALIRQTLAGKIDAAALAKISDE